MIARYNTIKYNDIANCPGVGISVFFQGCPHHCPNCFNKETWDFNGGKPFTIDTVKEICSHFNDNGIHRDLNILGGEPLCPENIFATALLVSWCYEYYPDVKIYLWTGYVLEDLKKSEYRNVVETILSKIYCLIDGPFIEDLKQLNMPLRGSTNQRIIYSNI